MRLIKGLITRILNPTKPSSSPAKKPNSKCLSLPINTLKKLHSYMITIGLHHHQENYIAVKLITITTNNSSSPKNIAYARSILDSSINTANVYLWTSMITLYSKHKTTYNEALGLYKKMILKGIKPNSHTLSVVLKVCSFLEDETMGKMVHVHVVKTGLDLFVYVKTALMDMYAKLRCMESASLLFDVMPERNVVACNSMIVGYGKAGCVDFARKVFDEMGERDLVSWTAMIAGYTNHGNMREAQILFDQMPKRDVNSWNALITGYSHSGDWFRALQLFHEMRLQKFKPNQVTMAVMFSVCGHIGSLDTAKQIHEQLINAKRRVEVNTHVLNSLVDMYSKCGSADDSYRVFCNIPRKDIVSYNVMISGFAIHGYVEKALKLFDELLEEGLQPDQITLTGVLTACRHAGLLEKGCEYFERMVKDYRVEPSVDNYACMVDLLGRSGLVEEAYNLVKTMNVEPHAGVWGALLVACRDFNNVDIGEIAAEKLFVIAPENNRSYLLLSNIYASANMWDDVDRVRSWMRQRGVDTPAGFSWIDVDGFVQKFFNGDKTHLESDLIYEALRHLSQESSFLDNLPISDASDLVV